MKKLLIAVVGCALAVAVDAQTLQGPVVQKTPQARKVTPGRMKHIGGFLIKPGSQKGVFAFMNAQKRVDAKVIDAVAEKVRQFIRIATAVAEVKEVAFADMGAALDATKSRAGLIVVDDPKLPMLLVAPEGRWAYVNVAALAADGAEKAKVEKRLTQELWRGFCYVGGCSPSESVGCAMNPVFSVGGLDAMPWDMISMEPLSQLYAHFKRMGITPAEMHTYREACAEGWAPAPTNEFQKAIWDKAHELPKKPLKIEFDKKKGE